MKKTSIRQYLVSSVAAGLLATAFLSSSSMAHEYKVGDIEVIHPIALPTPPGAPMAAGYLEVINRGDKDDRLIGGGVPFAAELQIHETTVEGDVSRMRRLVDGVVIPAGETVKLAPMGKHLMFTELAEPLVEGEKQSGILSFEKAGDLEVVFNIEQADTAAKPMDHGKMGEDGKMPKEMGAEAMDMKGGEKK